MKFGEFPIDEAVGKILAHKLVDADGKKVLGKGIFLTEKHISTLRKQGLSTVIAADIAPEDLHEDEGAERIGIALAGEGLRVVAPGSGRANVISTVRGPLRVNVPMLEQVNIIAEGITVATLREHTLVNEGDLVGLVKIIPFGIERARVVDVEAVTREATAVLSVKPLRSCRATLIISGPGGAKSKLIEAFEEPIRRRIENLESTLECIEMVEHSAPAVADAIRQHADKDLILIASISAIIDKADVVPTALQLAGGSITQFGAPVDPGSLMMLGYLERTPVVGMPGCVQSLKTNIIDWILPRLIAGEHLTRADIIVMGHGGLLDDISERPMPR